MTPTAAADDGVWVWVPWGTRKRGVSFLTHLQSLRVDGIVAEHEDLRVRALACRDSAHAEDNASSTELLDTYLMTTWRLELLRRVRRCASDISTHYPCRDVGPVARTEVVNVFGTPSRRRGTADGLLGSTGAGDVASGGDGGAALPLARRRSGSGSGLGRGCADLRCALQAYGEGPGRSRSGPISIHS